MIAQVWDFGMAWWVPLYVLGVAFYAPKAVRFVARFWRTLRGR